MECVQCVSLFISRQTQSVERGMSCPSALPAVTNTAISHRIYVDFHVGSLTSCNSSCSNSGLNSTPADDPL